MKTFGIMFHHFHNDFHLKSQGSISKKVFNQILDFLESKYNILDPDEFIERFIKNNLTSKETCITFDDSLRCQYDIALPVLEERGIKAFFFVYSSALTDSPDMLEIYRYVRNSFFPNIELFYSLFFNLVSKKYQHLYKKAKESFSKLDYLAGYPFYSKSDKLFRYLRDNILNDGRYENLMEELINELNFDIKSISEKLWMTQNQILDLFKKGHQIGLHSFSHPTKISSLDYQTQNIEYSKNLMHLENIIGKNNINSMSHPCGSYNEDTIKVLSNLKIKIGFRANMNVKDVLGKYEIPREDHSNILRLMNS